MDNPLPDDYYERVFGEPPTRGGLFAAQVERSDKPHRCGRCNNGTGIYNPDCPNNREVPDER